MLEGLKKNLDQLVIKSERTETKIADINTCPHRGWLYEQENAELITSITLLPTTG